MEDYTNKYKGEQVEIALFGGEYQDGVLTAYCYLEDVAHVELNGHILIPLQNVASLHCSSPLRRARARLASARPRRRRRRRRQRRRVVLSPWDGACSCSGTCSRSGRSSSCSRAPSGSPAGSSAATGSRSSSSRSIVLLAAAIYAYADRIVMGMLGAREMAEGEAPALHSMVERLARSARVVKPRLYVLADSYPRALSAGRGAGGGSGLALSVGLLGVASPAELEGIVAHEIAHLRNRDVLVQTVAVIVATTIVESLADRRRAAACAPHRARPARRGVRAPAALAEARVRGRPPRRRAVRLTARARRRAAAARAGDGARPLRGEPRERAALHDEPVRRAGPRGALRDAPAGLASGCSGCASSTRAGARSSAPPRRSERRRAPCGALQRNGRRPTLPGDCSPSTIGADGLNFSVRNGKRCFPVAMTTQFLRRSL